MMDSLDYYLIEPFGFDRGKSWIDVVELTSEKLISPGEDDDEEREELGVSEDILHSRRPFHVPAVDERKDACNRLRKC